MLRGVAWAAWICSLTCACSGGSQASDDGAPPDGGPGADGGSTADASSGDAPPCNTAGVTRDLTPEALPSSFRRTVLETDFFAEGATFGDFDRDGITDIVAGPYWYAGPDFRTRHEFAKPETSDPYYYSSNFFAFVHDFDADGWDDVLVIGFPGQEATWYENPGDRCVTRWPAHRAFDVVDNESPWFTDLTGDGKPEIVMNFDGRFGWAEPDWSAPADPWTFHPLSPDEGAPNFTHGLGVGDVNGDGRLDVLDAGGWWEQPASLAGDPDWTRHAQAFGPGGAQMFVDDVDGDGDGDVITTLEAHGYGVSWFEQYDEGGERRLREHRISGSPGDEGPTGIALHEPHALTLFDMNGDGLRDIVTGERFWGHVPAGDPDFADPAALVWFELQRSAGSVTYVGHRIDDASGVGTQVVASDADGDGLGDVVIASKKGIFAFLQQAE